MLTILTFIFFKFFSKTSYFFRLSEENFQKIPESVTEIGYCAFEDIDTVYYNGTAEGSPWEAKQHIKKQKSFQKQQPFGT